MSSGLTDKQLTIAIKSSDADAFKTFYHKYFEKIFQFLWGLTLNPEHARDLTQEAFLRIWVTRDRLQPERSIKAYLYRIANNLAVDDLRKKLSQADYLEQMPAAETASFQEENVLLREKILSSIDELPDPLRLVFTLSRFEGLKYTEIAEALDVSIKTVESRMSKALKILRKKVHPFLATILALHFFS